MLQSLPLFKGNTVTFTLHFSLNGSSSYFVSIYFKKETQAEHQICLILSISYKTNYRKTLSLPSNENSKTTKSAFKLSWFFLCISVTVSVEELLQLYEELEQTSSWNLNLGMNL